MLLNSFIMVSLYFPDSYLDTYSRTNRVIESPYVESIFSIILGIDDVSKLKSACLMFSAICRTYLSSEVWS